MNNSPSYGLLLEDVQGHEQHHADTQNAPSFKKVKVLKGSLVESLIPSDIPLIKNYKQAMQYIRPVHKSDLVSSCLLSPSKCIC